MVSLLPRSLWSAPLMPFHWFSDVKCLFKINLLQQSQKSGFIPLTRLPGLNPQLYSLPKVWWEIFWLCSVGTSEVCKVHFFPNSAQQIYFYFSLSCFIDDGEASCSQSVSTAQHGATQTHRSEINDNSLLHDTEDTKQLWTGKASCVISMKDNLLPVLSLNPQISINLTKCLKKLEMCRHDKRSEPEVATPWYGIDYLKLGRGTISWEARKLGGATISWKSGMLGS